ncbi:MAG TPA: hypothetical protein VFT74_09350, partial [Isosphaeraceae bacterium]|nr:hypothetical protein [Isosphaeraceae bacterium]
MLLDFNLALDGRAEDDGSTCRGGGTLAYMSPERLKALVDSEDQEEAPPLDRHRADLYALGHVLLEMFRGEPPSIPEDIGGGKRRIAARLAETRSNTDLNGLLRRAGVPSGLRPVLKRCLAADPADRYGRGRELAADLDRWWQNRPLLFASEPSWPARAKRWARSRKRPLLVGALMLAMGGIVEVGTSCYLNGSMSERAKTKLELLWSGEEPGVYRFLVQNHWRPDDTLDPRIARRQRALYGLLEPDAAHWRTRSDVTHLPVEDREDLELWLLDRTWTEATARLERSDDAQDLQRALADLEQVPEWAALGPILRLRSQIRHDLDLPEPPNLSADRTTPEWLSAYLKGLAVEFENASEALVEYRHSLKLRPESYWANYRAASACFRLGDYEGAIKHLDRCLHRRPNIGALHAQKSACLYLLNDDAGSLQESNLAVRLDPDQPYAFQNRAFVRARIGQSDGLQADLRRFSSLVGAPRKAAQWEIRLQTMLGLQHTVPIDALELMETMIPVEDMEIRNSLAAMLDEMGHPEEAL